MKEEKKQIRHGKVSTWLLLLNCIVVCIYLSWWFVPSHVGNPFLYSLLLVGELYHIFMASTFWYTLWPGKKRGIRSTLTKPEVPVDVLITVAGESADIIRKTALAAKNLDYTNHTVTILNDGYVANKPNWKAAEVIAEEVGVRCITRKTKGGAKAGNINHALGKTVGELVVIFDADMVPHEDFLQKTVPYFADPSTGFVQTPQYYKNKSLNEVSGAAWDQQEIFFGPILMGKDRTNSAFICGTNVIIRRSALYSVGGMVEDNIAEDFLTSLYIHQKGWKSYYRKEVLAEGLAPEDLQSYYKQQLRWARGSLEVLFGANPFFKRHLTFSQRLQYLSSGMYWCNGIVVMIDALIPLIFLSTGIQPVAATTTSFALYFVPFIFLALYTLYKATNGSISFRALSFSHSSFFLQIQALLSILARRKMDFSVTSKNALSGNFIYLAYPHIIYSLLTVVAFQIGIYREGFTPAVVTNGAWALFNVIIFMPYVISALQSSQNLATQKANNQLTFETEKI